MGTEYNLLTCLGKGTTVTLTIASPCVVTLALHGMRDGHPVVFSDNSNTLPTGLTKGTTYYVRSTAANTFNLYDTAANAKNTGSTTGRINTSGSQSGTHILVGDYWYRLPSTDTGNGGNYKARYGSAGSEKVYRRMFDWYESIPANRSFKKSLVLEIQGAWVDSYSNYSTGQALTGFESITITTKINGVSDPDSFHNGRHDTGYLRIETASGVPCIRTDNLNTVVDGVDFKATGSSASAFLGTVYATIRNCILQGTLDGVNSEAHRLYNNIVHDCPGIGIGCVAYRSGAVVFNNLVIGCGTGISGANSYTCFVVNNCCIGNTTNWGTAPSAGFFANNAGASGDTIWTSSGETSKNVSSSDFVNYVVPVTSSSNFAPSGDSVAHTSSSNLVDFAIKHYDWVVDADMLGNPRPSYKNGSTTYPDIGPIEFDWGYGPEPQQVTLAISGMVEGSILAIYKTSDGSAIISPTTIGASGSYVTTYSYTGNTQIEVVVRKGSSGTKYLPYSAPGLITSGGFGLVVNQAEDLVLNG